MNRVIRTVGSLLVLAGLAVLAYVGVVYAREATAPRAVTHHWSAAQQATGKKIAARLAHRQRVALPASLKHNRITPGSEPALRMVISKIGVNAPVVQTPPVGGVWNVADWAVGHLTSTPNPGAAGNAGYAAHDDIKGELFKRLGVLGPGDTVLLYTRHAVYRYTVTGQEAVDPSNVSVLNPTRASTITLISCTPYWVDTQRIIVHAQLTSTSAV